MLPAVATVCLGGVRLHAPFPRSSASLRSSSIARTLREMLMLTIIAYIDTPMMRVRNLVLVVNMVLIDVGH